MFDDRQLQLLLPVTAIGLFYLTFCLFLSRQRSRPIFGELGFIFLSFAVAYAIIPAINFLAMDFTFPPGFDSLNFAVLKPTPQELTTHLWRFALFIFAVGSSYLLVRGSQDFTPPPRPEGADRILALLLILIVACVGIVAALSAPVEKYTDHYLRFSQLTGFWYYLVQAAGLIKSNAIYIMLVLMFSNERRYRLIWPILVAALIAYEITYSFGARIQSLFIFLATASLFHFYVKRLKLLHGAWLMLALALFFTAVEFYRSAGFNLDAAIQSFTSKGASLASEFGAVYYTSFHLYHERALGLLPEPHWRMLINDFLMFVPFVDHITYNSQFWYAAHYFPKAVVPPQTMGPIADSAIWGGEIDLAVRGVLTGSGLGLIARWVLQPGSSWIKMTIYTYLYASAVMVLKYSLIYQMSQVLRLLPMIGIVWLSMKVVTDWKRLAKDRIRITSKANS